MLLSKRNETTLKLLRLVMTGYLVADAIAIGLNFAIYIKPWEESVLNIYSAVLGSIWLVYFHLSTRVKAVFVTHTWVESHSRPNREPSLNAQPSPSPTLLRCLDCIVPSERWPTQIGSGKKCIETSNSRQ